MLFVSPATSTIRPASYLTPQPYEYYPSQDYYHSRDAPRFAAPSYPAPQPHFFHQPSAEELEEIEYQRALEIVANHRRRKAEQDAAIHRQQQVEAARQRYLAALAAELEQRREEELLADRRAEFIRSQQVRARLVAAERQHALDAFLHQLKGPQPVCHVCVPCHRLDSKRFYLQTTRQPHVAKRESLVDALKKRLAAESDADVTKPIRNIIPSLEPRPAQSEKPKDTSEDAADLVENLLSSIFPGLVSHTQPQPAPSTEKSQPSVAGEGKGKARAVDVEVPQKPAPKSESAGESFVDILRHIMEVSKSTPAPRSPDEAGPSGSSSSSSSPARPAVTEREQAQIDRAIALSSVEQVQSTLAKLQTEFVLPSELDHYTPSDDDRDETASISSASSSNIAKLIPHTSINKPVYKYENELNGLLEELDRIDSHGDAEVREKRKGVVKAIEKALEGVERVVGEAVEKRLSLVSSTTPPADGLLKGFDVGEEVIEDIVPTQEQAIIPVVIDDAVVPEPFTSVQVEETPVVPAEVPSLINDTLPKSDTSVVLDPAADLPTEPASNESDVQASTATITPASVELTPATETESAESQVPVDVLGTVDTLSPEEVSPPSPAEKPQEVGNDTDEEVVELDSDAEKSDWSEVEH